MLHREVDSHAHMLQISDVAGDINGVPNRACLARPRSRTLGDDAAAAPFDSADPPLTSPTWIPPPHQPSLGACVSIHSFTALASHAPRWGLAGCMLVLKAHLPMQFRTADALIRPNPPTIEGFQRASMARAVLRHRTQHTTLQHQKQLTRRQRKSRHAL